MSVMRASMMLALGFLAACTVEEPGKSVAGPAQSAAATQASPSPRELFDDVEACEVLDRAVVGQGFPPGTFSGIGSDNGCRTQVTGTALGLTLDDRQGIDALAAADPGKSFSGHVGERRAVQVKDSVGDGGACEIGIEVAPQARAVVMVVLGSNRPTDEACSKAKEIATAIEPVLPMGE
ncbi:DUF3558 family protein [Amycolatopsis albispora]|uniref:DUF3558 domain-containing protein n=1 Tax=Amycolatopsis albispora TaxID=1804986 RepID=A0A344LHQ5_9PSEU|nr:DUF3558 family protein [Amycolatopsis albispora]AXB47579.1 hypothetical protein A4R43_38210 [Amycolatopsis albispora]